MEKKCRTCDTLQGYCHAAGILPPGGGTFGCELWGKRETPPLVNELADAVSALMVGLTKSAHEQGEAALARYQKEVGDA
ncbi:unnamed protein product [marine sediment metagenome]|uniref:Uncharacterized protein n=1 Tax=marine sediment metagenome TaxID=412755 RepID=X0X9S7_9ZZZZ